MSVAASTPLVSVVVPAYNAAATLGETLDSVCAQTWRELEILVVDDGSRDGTLALARGYAARDPRVRVIAKENGGVATARNAGIRESRGAFVAPVDADDLWHAAKIERQMRRMEALGPACGYVYCLSRRIDGRSRIIGRTGVPGFEGAVFARGIVLNHVGNGSAPLFRRAALEEIGGYEPALHRARLQGAEDILVQALVAHRWTVGCVPEFLTGYRTVPGRMSDNAARMARSALMAYEIVARECPDTPPEALAAARLLAELALAAALRRSGERAEAARLAAGAARAHPLLVAETLFWEVAAPARRVAARLVDRALGRSRDPALGLPFAEADPRAGPPYPRTYAYRRLLRRLETAESTRPRQRPAPWRDGPLDRALSA